MSETIRVERDTHAALAALKGPDETFGEVISRLLEDRRESVHEGAGYWSESDAADCSRDARRSMKRDIGDGGRER